jgi:hypothetical protein
MDVLVHHIPGQNIISLARNKAEADNNVKDYNGITILYFIGGMTDMTNKLEEININNDTLLQEVDFKYRPNMLFDFKQKWMQQKILMCITLEFIKIVQGRGMGDFLGILLEPPELFSCINTLESPHRAVGGSCPPLRE